MATKNSNTSIETWCELCKREKEEEERNGKEKYEHIVTASLPPVVREVRLGGK